jgi:hypothetical protein
VVAVFKVVSCLAVIEAYLEALDPAVILFVSEVGIGLAVGVSLAALAKRSRACLAAGVSGPREGVLRPAGVTLPFESDTSGVLVPRELVELEGVNRPDKEGVTRPPLEEATDGGRPGTTVGADSLVVATKTPHLSGQEK